MSDETTEPTEPGGSSEPSEPSEPSGAGPRPKPAAPGAAAARRARQMGGTRRPSPRPTPDPANATTATAATPVAGTATEADDADSVSLAKPAARPAPAAPRSSVGKAAARPRPRPRPTPVAEEAVVEEAATADDATPRRSRRFLVGAGALLTVLLLATGVVFLVLTLTAAPAVSQRETDRAVAAAKADVALVTSYGYQTVDADTAKAAAVLTGQFKQQYLDAVAKTVKPQLPSTQTVSTGQVDTAGLVSADSKGRQVVVLVYGQQSVTNKAQTTPRIDAFQVRVTMQLVGGQWLVSQLEQLGNNA